MKGSPIHQVAGATADIDTDGRTLGALQRVLYLILFQLRLITFWGYVVLSVLAVGVVLLLTREGQPTAYYSFYQIFEPLFPLALGFLFVPLVMREQEQQTLVLVGVSQCSLPLLFVVRLLLITFFAAMLVAILVLMLQLSPPLPDSLGIFQDPQIERDLNVWLPDLLGGPNGIPAVLLTLGAPTFFLAGIGTAMAHLTADARVGYLAVFVVWMFNRAVGLTLDAHPLFRYIYLFTRSGGSGDWLMPKVVQLGLGIGSFFVSWLLLHRLERFLRKP